MIARLRDSNVMPLALALQGLLLSIATLFLASGLSPLDGSSIRGGFGAARTQDGPVEQDHRVGGSSIASLPRTGELPRDLFPQRLPVPRLPEREEPNRPPQPAPEPEGFDGVPVPEGSKLASLRVADIALAGLIPTSMTVPIPEAPDRLDGHSLTGASRGWLMGSSRGRGSRPGRNPGGRGGGGGVRGIGGAGGGGGGYCPTPTGAVGRPVGGRGRGRGGTTSGGSGGTTSAGSGSSGGTKGTPTSRPGGSKSGGSGGSRGKGGKGK